MGEKLQYWEKITYNIIVFSIADNGGASTEITNAELAEKIGASTRTAVRHVKKLERLGFIDVSYGYKKRIIKLKGGN